MTSRIFARRNRVGVNAGTGRKGAVKHAAGRVCEPLEQRVLMSTIQWVNKGTLGNDTDNFNATYGGNSTIARNIVQRAIDDWERVIVDFNYVGGGNTFNITINAGPINGRGVTTNYAADPSGKILSASITMDDDAGLGWYFDPVIGTSAVPDDGEFINLASPFEASFTGVGGANNDDDMYRTAAHELGHAFGIFTNNGGVVAGNPAILGFLTDTNIDDPLDNTNPSTLVNFNVGGGAVEATFTENGGGHFYEGAPQGGGTLSHPNDLLNPGRTVGGPPTTRQLISDLDATILNLAYGYTIQLPSTLNTFCANLNTTTNVVTVTGDADLDGDDADIIDLEVTGTAMRFEVNNTFETIEGAQFTTINVDAGGDNDDIDVDALLASKTLTVNGEAGNDSVDVAAEVDDVDSSILSNFTFNGGTGTTDTLRFHDTLDAFGSDTYEFTTTAATKASRDVNYANVESLIINGSSQNSTYNIESLSTDLTGGLDINAGSGNDQITLGGLTGDIDSTIRAGVQVNGGGGDDTMILNDSDDDASVDDSYTLTSFGFDKSSTSEVWGFAEVEHVSLVAGLADNTINVISMSTTLAPTLQTLVISAGEGDDTIDMGNDLDSNFAFVDVTVNGNAGSDTLILDDLGDDGADDYTITSTTFDKSTVGVALFTFGTIEAMTLNANPDANEITITGTFNGAVRVNGNGGADTFDIIGNFNNQYVTVDGGSGLDNVLVNSDGIGGARVQFVNSQDLQSLSLSSAGTARVNAGGDKLLNTRTLSIAATGRLDMTDNDMLLDYPAASQLNAVQTLINQGRAGGLWSGFGITSGTAGANALNNTTLGAMEATQYDSIYGAGALFNGVDPDNTAVLVKYTYYGDADFNGQVNFDDYSRTDAGFINNRTGWINGDFDGNGTVNFDDYSLIDLAFNTQSGVLRPGGEVVARGQANKFAGAQI